MREYANEKIVLAKINAVPRRYFISGEASTGISGMNRACVVQHLPLLISQSSAG